MSDLPRSRTWKVDAHREQHIEATVVADSKSEAEEIVFTAQADGTRPKGLLDFWEDNNTWHIDARENR